MKNFANKSEEVQLSAINAQNVYLAEITDNSGKVHLRPVFVEGNNIYIASMKGEGEYSEEEMCDEFGQPDSICRTYNTNIWVKNEIYTSKETGNPLTISKAEGGVTVKFRRYYSLNRNKATLPTGVTPNKENEIIEVSENVYNSGNGIESVWNAGNAYTAEKNKADLEAEERKLYGGLTFDEYQDEL